MCTQTSIYLDNFAYYFIIYFPPLNCKLGLDINIHECFYMTYVSMAVVGHLNYFFLFCYYKNLVERFSFYNFYNFWVKRNADLETYERVYSALQRGLPIYTIIGIYWPRLVWKFQRNYFWWLWLNCKLWIPEIMFSVWLA